MIPKIRAYTTAIAEPSVAVKIPPMIPPITTIIRERAGIASTVAFPRFFQSYLPGVPFYPFFFAIIIAPITQANAQRIPGT